jgi:hypothetical protein
MLSVFGDESHDQTKKRVFVVAGLLGNDKDWESFRQQWKERTRGLIFHAADCESGHGDFKEMPEPKRLKLHLDLTQILADSKLMGYGYAVDLAGCCKVVPHAVKQFPDMPYYDCFVKAVGYLSDLAQVFVPRDRVEFTFDQHKETQYNAGLLYDWLSHYKDDVVEKVSFGTRKEPGIQGADLWARELMKRCDSRLFNSRTNPRPQWNTLLGTRRFRFKFVLGDQFQKDMDDAAVEYQASDQLHAEYEEWRRKHRLVDNLSNRFRWFAMQDKARHDTVGESNK